MNHHGLGQEEAGHWQLQQSRVSPVVFMKVDKHKGQQEAGRGHNLVAVLYKQILPEDTGESKAKQSVPYQKHKTDMWETEEMKVTWWKEEGEHIDLITQWREGKQGTGETIQGGGQEQRHVMWSNLCRRVAPLIELCISSRVSLCSLVRVHKQTGDPLN